MSNPTRYNIKPGAEGYEIAVSLGGEWVRWTDYRASSFVTAVPVEQYERVVKAGDAMSGWPVSTGESIHTSTFLGHPGGCAAASATLKALDAMDARTTVSRLGMYLRNHLDVLALKHASKIMDIRGKGLMLGIQMDAPGAAVALSDALLQLGIITLPAGNGDVLELTPPFVVREAQLDFVVTAIDQTLTA